jgi:hypothetical protein
MGGKNMAEAKTGSKGFGIAAMILGIVGIVGSWIPILNWFSLVLGILAIIFGIIAVVKGKGKGQGVAGVILGGATVVIFLIINVILAAALTSTVDTVNKTNWTDYQTQYQDLIENSKSTTY